MIRRRFIAYGIGAIGCAIGGTAARAAEYPARPVRIIVGYPPGGTTDILARLVASQLQSKLGGTFLVENKPGAGGGLGVAMVAKSAPDGYVLGLGSAGNLALNYATYNNIPYDSIRDLTPLSLIAAVPNVLVINSKVPVHTVAELIAYLKQKKNGFFGSSGVGNGPHLTGELFKARTGLNLTHVPYQGSSPAEIALVAGEVDFMFDNLPAALPFIQGGKVRAIAVTSAKRSSSLPDVPTMQEQGMKDFTVDAWFALVGPKGMKAPVVQRLEQAVAAASQNASFIGAVRRLGADPELTAGAQLEKLIKFERQRWPELLKTVNAKS